ncbi:hypothetical protein ElyMa_006948700 [Elysia marginata]|uniref:Uncharacterized protein n=1 Tax=Elysia marginata TaxID=1093978 RepID=A0AAV4JIW5_9GAST|nr:hypothetical protein ElyMa_006948700 [Elysia marginata]
MTVSARPSYRVQSREVAEEGDKGSPGMTTSNNREDDLAGPPDTAWRRVSSALMLRPSDNMSMNIFINTILIKEGISKHHRLVLGHAL